MSARQKKLTKPKPKTPLKKPKKNHSTELKDGYETMGGFIGINEIVPAGSTKEAKVQNIMMLMRGLRWETGETLRLLADIWGQSYDTVRFYSAEASRRVKAEINNPEFVNNTVASALLAVLRNAMRDEDRRSIISASKTWAEISANLQANEKPTSQLSDDELQALAHEAIELLRNKQK